MLDKDALNRYIKEGADGSLVMDCPRREDYCASDSALIWLEIFAEVRKRYPDNDFQFIEHSYIEKVNKGHLIKEKLLQSVLAIPII